MACGRQPPVAEADAFIHIGRHLHSKGLPVPTIHFADAFAGLVFLETWETPAFSPPSWRSRTAGGR